MAHMANCNCSKESKEKKLGVFRCRKHEPEFFEDETPFVTAAAMRSSPSEGPPEWATRLTSET